MSDKKMNVIAEFGVNWKDLKTFREMIKQCAEVGIRYAKMQLWMPIPQVPKAVHSMYIDEEKAHLFKKYAEKNGIDLFFTPFYARAVDICKSVGVSYYKVRYRDRNRYDLYTAMKYNGRPTFVSVPLIKDTIWKGHKNARYLFCVPKYPAVPKDYENMTPHLFHGVSDHTKGITVLERARDMGFEWFEKHVCLDEHCYEREWSIPIKNLEGLI